MFKVRPILALSAAFLLPTSAAGLQAQEQVGAGGDRPVRVSFSDSPELSEEMLEVSTRMLSSGTSTQTTSRPIPAFRASRFGSGRGLQRQPHHGAALLPGRNLSGRMAQRRAQACDLCGQRSLLCLVCRRWSRFAISEESASHADRRHVGFGLQSVEEATYGLDEVDLRSLSGWRGCLRNRSQAAVRVTQPS